MLRTAIAGSLALLIFAALSQAADLGVPRPGPGYTAPAAPVVEPAPLWQGLYGGLNAGHGWGFSTVSSAAGADGSVSPEGFLGGVTLGYNSQIGGFVLGAESDLDYSWMKNANASTACFDCDIRNRYLATFRGRAGYILGNWLPYVTGGAAVGDIQLSTPAAGSQAINKLGWTVGGGVEYGLPASSWSLSLEYLYADLGSATCDASHCGVETNADLKADLVRAGIKYHF